MTHSKVLRKMLVGVLSVGIAVAILIIVNTDDVSRKANAGNAKQLTYMSGGKQVTINIPIGADGKPQNDWIPLGTKRDQKTGKLLEGYAFVTEASTLTQTQNSQETNPEPF